MQPGRVHAVRRLETSFVRESTENDDRNDYRISGTLRWDDEEALSCFDDGYTDWAYEHELRYWKHFDRKIWNVDLSSFPDGAEAYVDTTVMDDDGVTTLDFGISHPEKLTAGVDYTWSFETFLPDDPDTGRHPLTLGGEVVEKSCAWGGPWCVNVHMDKNPDPHELLVGRSRGVSVLGSTCWSWTSDGGPGGLRLVGTACSEGRCRARGTTGPRPGPTGGCGTSPSRP